MSGRARTTKISYTAADLKAVSDNPDWTAETTARSRTFDETFPDLARRVRGRQRAPTKKQITLRLDERVIDHFKATGSGWQSRINEVLKKSVGL